MMIEVILGSAVIVLAVAVFALSQRLDKLSAKIGKQPPMIYYSDGVETEPTVFRLAKKLSAKLEDTRWQVEELGEKLGYRRASGDEWIKIEPGEEVD